MKHKKFEYRAIKMSRPLLTITVMNKFGDDGWELVHIEKDNKEETVLCTFKREVLK